MQTDECKLTYQNCYERNFNGVRKSLILYNTSFHFFLRFGNRVKFYASLKEAI